jgi:hypothetical protein
MSRRDAASREVPALIERLNHALNQPNQPHASFQAFDEACGTAFGHRLFTILAWRSGENEVERVYSSRPIEYPLAARKRMGPTPWGALVLGQAQPWLGRHADDLRWAFPDHELIASLGCSTCLNAPVRWKGTVLGAINILDAAGSYADTDLALLSAISSFLIGPLLEHRAQSMADQ